jgi:Ca-activated chloride channel homolog
MYTLQFAYPIVFYIFVPLFCFLFFIRWRFVKNVSYLYPLSSCFQKNNLFGSSYHRLVYRILRSFVLLALLFLMARPQWIDRRSQMQVDGIDMILTLDVSGSMRIFDDVKERKPRIEVAKQEALRFIEKRAHDPMGIVVFGADAVSRCPLTLDKNILKEIVSGIKLGMIPFDGTILGTGLGIAINRLRNSASKNKVIILLTDGRPEGPDRITPEKAMDLAKKFGIKVYTIGIGKKTGGYLASHFGFIQQVPDTVDEVLLKRIAKETGGLFFRAGNSAEMRHVYETIDALERTKYETSLFSNHYEAFLKLILLLFVLLLLEVFLKTTFWRGIGNG